MGYEVRWLLGELEPDLLRNITGPKASLELGTPETDVDEVVNGTYSSIIAAIFHLIICSDPLHGVRHRSSKRG